MIEWSRGGRNLAYLITSATAGWVCSSEIMSGDQTGLAEQSDDTCRTVDELQSKGTAGDQKGNSNLCRSCRSRRRPNRDGMLGGARPDEIRWRGETKCSTACVSVRRSSRRRQYFYRAGKNILGDGFSSVESEWRSKRFFFHHVKYA